MISVSLVLVSPPSGQNVSEWFRPVWFLTTSQLELKMKMALKRFQVSTTRSSCSGFSHIWILLMSQFSATFLQLMA